MSLKTLLNKLYSDPSNHSALEIKYPAPVGIPSPALNWVLNGGIRPGAFYCFMGPEQSGKSFLALCCLAELLKKDPESVAFWFDCEFSFSTHFKSIFLPDPKDAERLIVRRSDPPTGAEIFDYFANNVLGLVQDGLKVAGCVVDSLQTIMPPKEANMKSTEDNVMGDLSSYLPKALRLISSPCKPRIDTDGFEGIPWIFISQVRDNLDPSAAYTGDKYKRSGGRAFGHSIDVEVLFEQIGAKATKIFDENAKNMNDSSSQVGHKVRAKIKKNRFGPPRIGEFDIHYGRGIINQEVEIATLAKNQGILAKEGNTWYFVGDKLGVGEAAMIQRIGSDLALQQQMVKLIMEKSDAAEKSISVGGSSPQVEQSNDS